METRCNHRRCAIPKLIILIKMASENPPKGMTSEDVIDTGLHNLRVLGATMPELIEAKDYLAAVESAMADEKEQFTSGEPRPARSDRDHQG